MLIKNVDDTLVNGSLGQVTRFANPARYMPETNPSVLGRIGRGGDLHYPIVEFVLPSGGSKRMLVMHEMFKAELPNGQVQASRRQVCQRFSLLLTVLISNSYPSSSRGQCQFISPKDKHLKESR
jgi:hypothetical protein